MCYLLLLWYEYYKLFTNSYYDTIVLIEWKKDKYITYIAYIVDIDL